MKLWDGQEDWEPAGELPRRDAVWKPDRIPVEHDTPFEDAPTGAQRRRVRWIEIAFVATGVVLVNAWLVEFVFTEVTGDARRFQAIPFINLTVLTGIWVWALVRWLTRSH